MLYLRKRTRRPERRGKENVKEIEEHTGTGGIPSDKMSKKETRGFELKRPRCDTNEGSETEVKVTSELHARKQATFEEVTEDSSLDLGENSIGDDGARILAGCWGSAQRSPRWILRTMASMMTVWQ